MFSSLTASEIDDTFTIFPPFYTDCGKNIRIGKNVFINSGCCFQDQNREGKRVWFTPLQKRAELMAILKAGQTDTPRVRFIKQKAA